MIVHVSTTSLLYFRMEYKQLHSRGLSIKCIQAKLKSVDDDACVEDPNQRQKFVEARKNIFLCKQMTVLSESLMKITDTVLFYDLEQLPPFDELFFQRCFFIAQNEPLCECLHCFFLSLFTHSWEHVNYLLKSNLLFKSPSLISLLSFLYVFEGPNSDLDNRIQEVFELDSDDALINARINALRFFINIDHDNDIDIALVEEVKWSMESLCKDEIAVLARFCLLRNEIQTWIQEETLYDLVFDGDFYEKWSNARSFWPNKREDVEKSMMIDVISLLDETEYENG